MSRPDEIRRMFAEIHGTYDFLNHLLSFNRDRSWRRLTRAKVAARAGDRVLDVCAGTADLALEFHEHDGLVVASDFTPAMLAMGAEKVRQRGARTRLVVADTTALPFPDASFDIVTVAFGIRNVPDLDRGLAEMARVVRPGARIAILEFSRSPKMVSRALNTLYCRMVLPLVGRLFSGHRTAYRYLPASVDKFPDRWELARRMEAAGIAGVEITPMNFDLVTLHVGVRGSLMTSANTVEHDRFSVLLDEYGALDIKEVSAVLAHGLSQPRVDIAHCLRRSPGLPFELLPLAQAEEIRELFANAGVTSRIVPAAEVPLRPRAVRAEGATLSESELELRLPGGRPQLVSWDAREVELLSAVVLLRDLATEPAAGDVDDDASDNIELLAAAYKRATTGREWNSEARHRVVAYLLEPEGVAKRRLEILADIALCTGELYRITSDAFEFRCLGEGVASSSRSNMERLITLLDARISAEACRGAGWQAVATGDLAEAACASLEEYESWLRWRLALAQVQRAGEGTRGH